MTEAVAKVGAVVVNHDAGECLASCVASLRDNGVAQIVVVDNASSDRSIEQLARLDPAVVLLASARNLGYGAAANLGAQRLATPYVLVCNPDLVVEPGALARLAAVLDEQEDVGACGPQLRDGSGAVYPSARAIPSYGLALAHAFLGPLWPSNPLSRRYRHEDEPAEVARDADWLSGACLLVRKVAFDSLGGFDEGYFMYVEDLDLCWRLGRAGWRVRYEPQACALHLQGVSTARHPFRMQLAHHRSTWRFARRRARGGDRALLPLVGVALGVRLVAMLLHELAHQKNRLPRPRPLQR